MNRALNAEAELQDDIGSFSLDPEGFVLYAFPWGEGELAEFDGPDEWQRRVLREIAEGLKSGQIAGTWEAVQQAVASGHGIGKSALVAWLMLWAIATHEDTKGVVTANTDTQLRTKTWPELGKWHRLCICGHWFEFTATSLYSKAPKREKTWRIDAIPWSEINTEAFAGLHNQGKRILVIFDEASAISDKIWEVTEGALTDQKTEIIWCAFGNPTRNTGRFKDCFGKFKHRWKHQQIDSRKVKITNKAQLQKWVDDYGEDSDFVRVRVRGEFPNVGERQFVPISIVEAARGRHLRPEQYNFAPKIITVDSAWYGGDEIVIGLRQGLAYQQLMAFVGIGDDIKVAGYVAKLEDEHLADGVLIDQGYGTGIYSAGKAMGRNWILVSFGGASNTVGFKNKRAEMWGLGKQWLIEGGAIPDDPKLAAEICGPEYFITTKGEVQLESKDDMKKRGLDSPNRADAFMLSFAYPVQKKQRGFNQPGLPQSLEFARPHDYDPLGS